jgi:hypothetical protein
MPAEDHPVTGATVALYRKLAAEAREQAAAATTRQAREVLFALAASYERLAIAVGDGRSSPKIS